MTSDQDRVSHAVFLNAAVNLAHCRMEAAKNGNTEAVAVYRSAEQLCKKVMEHARANIESDT